jgi:hypothetical protein
MTRMDVVTSSPSVDAVTYGGFLMVRCTSTTVLRIGGRCSDQHTRIPFRRSVRHGDDGGTHGYRDRQRLAEISLSLK